MSFFSTRNLGAATLAVTGVAAGVKAHQEFATEWPSREVSPEIRAIAIGASQSSSFSDVYDQEKFNRQYNGIREAINAADLITLVQACETDRRCLYREFSDGRSTLIPYYEDYLTLHAPTSFEDAERFASLWTQATGHKEDYVHIMDAYVQIKNKGVAASVPLELPSDDFTVSAPRPFTWLFGSLLSFVGAIGLQWKLLAHLYRESTVSIPKKYFDAYPDLTLEDLRRDIFPYLFAPENESTRGYVLARLVPYLIEDPDMRREVLLFLCRSLVSEKSLKTKEFIARQLRNMFEEKGLLTARDKSIALDQLLTIESEEESDILERIFDLAQRKAERSLRIQAQGAKDGPRTRQAVLREIS